jgi:tRNA(Ile2) C34 agmatinyltransferase TiaS
MKCHRCGDTMILNKFYDYGGYSWGWKCTFCGQIIDHTVMQKYLKEVAQSQKSLMKEASIAVDGDSVE